ncbi:MAG TPA: STAS domain-containing protein [Stackebrandtia sp.]|jgi:anti-sigma B factor antagonist|uniref:STAS domain-containing protein n=1 Tax=Stackebrandtia sp. TaxID=2023065 RepID=UPI002D60E077|nr:STAS domain-containing protein [Stackebrandtia sp.]HZE42034.1 STAS domain-containing protein [Stackebrandtia sp.]
MELTIHTRTAGTRTVVDVGGEIDMYTATSLRERILQLLREGVTALAIDVNQVEFCDSTGLGVFIGASRRLREMNGSLIIVCARPQMLKIFQLTGLDKVLDIRDSLPTDG